ncbi:MAG: endonuclease MutS2 [Firmicutes bacterium]|nr:endonuclease MutS2 [Bacillota bacterium]
MAGEEPGAAPATVAGGEDAAARSLRVLEFPKIVREVAREAETLAGAERAQALRPEGDAVEARERQGESREADTLLARVPHPPVGPAEDVRPLIERAARGAALSGGELRAVAQVAGAARLMPQTLAAVDADRPLARLVSLAAPLVPLPEVEERIRRSITEAGEVADEASPLLAQLRRSARALATEVRERLESMVRSAATARYLQEPIVTLRAGRYVVPVRQEFRRMVPGLVHDTSASGQTLFVEPMAVLEVGNRLRAVEAQAREEAERVLRELSALVARHAAPLRTDVDVLAAMDAIFARARFGRRPGYRYPEIDERPRLVLRTARHPLLGEDAVPLDVEIGRTFHTLVVSGPNTGGKTVSLKTMGLLSAMALSGLAVPAGDGTSVGAFDHILADIGDEQSIEQSLSTFSSHLTAIVRYLALATPRSLVLLDELGAGTDPTEGAALATAILEHLHARGVRTVATTHLSDLRRFAASHAGAENGSVAFDPVSLRPTYRFELGVPGQSNALAIAARLGMDPTVLEVARARLRPEERGLEDLMRSVGEMRRALAEEEEGARRARRQAEALRAEVEAERRALAEERGRLLAEAAERAREIVRRARRESEAAIAALRAAQAGERPVEAAVALARRSLREAAPQEEGPPPPASPPLRRVAVGQTVLLHRLGQLATVLAEPDPDGKVLVQAGVVRLRLDLAELRAAPAGATARSPDPPPAKAGFSLLERARAAAPELDLRGLRADEALERLERWLDDALLAGLAEGRIVHGKGTGALRQVVADALRGRPEVADYRLGSAEEGGDGVTVVRFAGA